MPTATPHAARDGQRSRVYRAEDAWAGRLDAARRGAALATIGGSAVLLPAELRFGSLAAASAYAEQVLRLPPVAALASSSTALPAPVLRLRRGQRAAHWERPGVVALPVPRHGEPWALRQSVLLHELAHHVGELTGRAAGHRPPFPALVLLLVQAAMGDEAAFALRVAYGEEGVEVGAL
jgi:putative metallohydrolase (TIGR04338 family)